MHHLRRGIIGRIGGFAALCAILLLSLAPVASQTLAHARIESLLASVCASGAHASRDADHAQHGAAGHLQACAYCDLVAHAPTPPTPPHGTTPAATLHEVFATARFADAPRPDPLHAAQPRAPPALA